MFKLAKSAAEAAVFLFAAYAFATIPLGKRTALQHVIAILNTKEAAEAGQELKQAGGRVVDELWHRNLAGEPELPKLKPPQSKTAFLYDSDAGGPTTVTPTPDASNTAQASGEAHSSEPP